MPRAAPDRSIHLFIFALLLIAHAPLLSTAQSAQQKRLTQPQYPSATPQGKSTNFENSHEDKNVFNSRDVRALATTLAPAGSQQEKGAAVRAPPARRPPGTTSGLSRLQARSLQDWDVEDVVLLATVDGRIYARDRRTGAPRWELEADRPVVETIYHERNKSIDGSSPVNDEFLWIVEPSQNGALYGYIPGVSVGVNSLGLSIKDLNDNSPFVSEDPPIRYMVDRKTWLYTIDIASGNIQKMFSAGSSAVVDENSCRKVGGLENIEEDECPVTGTLNLGRTEYTVQISSSVTSELICTIRYFEWGPNQRDRDLISQYASTKDNRYVYTRYDGTILASEVMQGDSAPFYFQKFDAPVAQVFDVARPSNDDSPDAPLIVLPQPSAPMLTGTPDYDALDRVYIGCTDAGSWYALSEYHYPLVTRGASDAQCLSEPYRNRMSELKSESERVFKSALTGVHDVGLAGQSPNEVAIPLIGGPPEEGLVEAPPGSIQLMPQPSNWSKSASPLIVVLIALITYIAWPRIKAAPAKSYDFKTEEVISETAEQQVVAPAEQPVDFPPTTNEPAEVEKLANRVRSDTGLSVADVETAEAQEDEVRPLPDEARPASPKKKKAHRGKRGGKQNAEKEKAKQAAKAAQGSEEQPQELEKVSSDEASIKPDVVNKHVTLTNGTGNGLHNMQINFKKILGSGSGGTFVFEGTFEGRAVAVKRMLRQQYELASQEVALLEQSDEHTNVIRYFCRREDENFLYIALELCQASLWDLFKDGRGNDAVEEQNIALRGELLQDPQRTLRQLAEGLRYLHQFRVVHRDIKPQNMLVAYPRRPQMKQFPRLVISDFGLCKTLPENVSTLIGTTGNAGTAGWMAPELVFQPKDSSNNGSAQSTQVSNGSNVTLNGNGVNGGNKVKRAIDIFSLGCVFFYVLTQGQHPFDDDEGWMALRERNIKIGRAKNLHALEFLGPEPMDLITWMLSHEPEDRPTASQVLAHPFFWDDRDKLDFLSAASDRFDQEPRDGTSKVLKGVERYAEQVIPKSLPSAQFDGATHSHLRLNSSHEMAKTMSLPIAECNFLAALDRKFVDTLGRQRKYDPAKLTDLLRALRNKHHHYDDMPEDVKAKVGRVPDGYLWYWERRFPGLVVKVWRAVISLGLSQEDRFEKWLGDKGN